MERMSQYDIEAALLNIVKHRWPIANKIIDLDETVFVDENHKLLFRLFRNATRQGKYFDDLTLRSEYEDLGGDIRIYDIVASSQATPTNADEYINILIRYAKERILASYLVKSHSVDEPLLMLKEAMNRMEALDGMKEARVRGSTIAEVTENFRNTEFAKSISTGFRTIDELTGGIRPEEMTGLGAPPGAGKSALAAAMAYNIAVLGHTSLFFSKEMLETKIFARLLAAVSATEVGLYEKYRSGERQVAEKDVKIMESTMDSIASISDHLSFFDLEDSDEINVRTIKEEIMARNAQLAPLGRQVNFVVVDYMQLLDFDQGNNSLATAIGDVAKELKKIAIQQHCHILVLAAVNRSMGKSLQLEAFKDSSGIDFNVDNALMMVNRGPDLDTASLGSGWARPEKIYQPLVLRAVKMRNAENGGMGYLKFLGKLQRFEELSPNELEGLMQLLKEEDGVASKYQ